MKTPLPLRIILTAMAFLFASIQYSSGADDATKLSDELRQSVERGNGKIGAAELDATASKFKALLTKSDFTPTSDTASKIRDATSFAQAILRAESVPTMDIRSAHQPVLSAIDTYCSKLTDSIDPKWKHLPVSANVMPPAGVVNAASGMNPDAITDPKLKQEYLDLIAANQHNNLRNSQQKELRRARERILWVISSLVVSSQAAGWERSATLERFGKDSDSRAILEEHLKRAGK